MALSGSWYTNVGSYWRLSMEWDASQSVSGNYSTVNARLYWIARDSYGVHSSATKTAAIQHDNGSWSTHSAGGLAYLSGYQKKKIHEITFRVNHNSDGTGSFNLDAYFDAEVTLQDRYYGRIDLDQRSFSLNTIPRKSDMTTSASWTAGSNRTISVSRASSSFTHRVYIDVKNSSGNWVNIKNIYFGSSTSTSFSTAQNTEIFNALNTRGSCDTRMNLHTYSGSTDLGYNTYYGTVTAPSASNIPGDGIDNPTGISSASGQEDQTVWIDQDITVHINRQNSNFLHTLHFKDGNSGSIIHAAYNVSTSYTWSPSASELDAMYAQTPNSVEFDGQIDVYTYYEGERVRGPVDKDINFRVRNADPSFGTGFSYKDTSSIVNTTGNDQYILQNRSTVQVIIPSSAAASAVKGASMDKYEISVNGETKTVNYSSSTITVDFGTVDAKSNTSLTIKAVDSRGFSITKSKTMTIIPYNVPAVSFKAQRNNGFESETTLSLSGTLSTVSIDGTPKNNLVSATYRYKEAKASDAAYSSRIFFSVTGFPSYSATDVTLTLDNRKAYTIEVDVMDQFGDTLVTKNVSVGKPIMFIDPDLNSVGFGDFPQYPNEVLINGSLRWGSTQWAPDGQGENYTGGAMALNNSDITEANGIYYNDTFGLNNGEGINFLKSGAPTASRVRTDYDNFGIIDGIAYLNNSPIFAEKQYRLWDGGWYMYASQTVTPSKKLSECPNGWILCWSDYDDPTNTVNDYNFHYTLVPKSMGYYFSGKDLYCVIPRYESATGYTSAPKILYIFDDRIQGNDINDSPDNASQDVVLRQVLMW